MEKLNYQNKIKILYNLNRKLHQRKIKKIYKYQIIYGKCIYKNIIINKLIILQLIFQQINVIKYKMSNIIDKYNYFKNNLLLTILDNIKCN